MSSVFLLLLINRFPASIRIARLSLIPEGIAYGVPPRPEYIQHQHNIYIFLSISTIVQIGKSNRYGNKRKMSKPEIVFKVGAVRASVFRNTIEKGGQSIQMPKVAIEVRYKDKAGQWQGTNSLSINDLPKAILALQKAYEYLMEHKDSKRSGSSSVSDIYR